MPLSGALIGCPLLKYGHWATKEGPESNVGVEPVRQRKLSMYKPRREDENLMLGCSLGFRVQGCSGFRVQGSGFRV